MPGQMILHWSPRSPYVRKVMIAAHEMGLQDRIRIVRTVAGGTTPHRELMKINPVGKIPTLELEDGTAVYDSPVIIEYLSRLDSPKLTLVAPDAGGAERARAYAKRLGGELAVIDKRRTDDGTAEVMNVIGDVAGRTCIIQDDIVDTAGTITKAAMALKNNGAERVLACAVHGVLSGPAIERIEKSPIDKMIVTNTIPQNRAAEQCSKIVVLSVARLLGQAIKSIHEETSVSSLFV